MIFEKLEEYGCEEVAFFHNKDLGLKAIVAIRETALGQAVGGTRMRGYPSEEETLIDVLKLTRGMSRKASISELDCGGGKAVVIRDSRNKTEKMIKTYAKFIDTLKGRLLTGQDVGIDVEDTLIMKKETKYIVGTSEKVHDPSTASLFEPHDNPKACQQLADVNREDIQNQPLYSHRYVIDNFPEVRNRHIFAHLPHISAERAQKTQSWVHFCRNI